MVMPQIVFSARLVVHLVRADMGNLTATRRSTDIAVRNKLDAVPAVLPRNQIILKIRKTKVYLAWSVLDM
jgi:hypothetical protein